MDVAGVPSILIVEDQPETAEMLSTYFKAQGYQVKIAGWGKDALAFIEKTIPDLVMLDIRLPDIDGYEVCRQMREHRRSANVPIIFLTEKREREDRLAGLKLGAVDYITKPFDIQELRLRVRNVLRRADLEYTAHSITGLPGPLMSDEKLSKLSDESDWAILSVGLRGLSDFADAYGFVAKDEWVRAVALMLTHVVKESNDPEAFVGHLDDENLFVLLAPDEVKKSQEALRVRLEEARAFFYPRADWEAGQKDPETNLPKLDVAMGVLSAKDKSFSDLKNLKQAIFDAQDVVV